MRRLKRPEAAGLRERIMSGIVELPGGAASVPLGKERLTWVLARVVKGLCLRECGVLLDAATEWTVRKGNYESAITHDATWSVEIPATGDVSQRGTILIAKGEEPDKGIFNWSLVLYGAHPFLVTTLPKEGRPASAGFDESDGMTLQWPKAKETR